MVDRGDRRHSIGDHMTVARIYLMHAKDGLSAELEQELREVAELLSANIENSRGVEILRDVDDERRFMFIERWDSVEAHKAGAEAFLKLGIIKRSEEHTSELQSLMRISYAVFCLQKKK